MLSPSGDTDQCQICLQRASAEQLTGTETGSQLIPTKATYNMTYSDVQRPTDSLWKEIKSKNSLVHMTEGWSPLQAAM